MAAKWDQMPYSACQMDQLYPIGFSQSIRGGRTSNNAKASSADMHRHLDRQGPELSSMHRHLDRQGPKLGAALTPWVASQTSGQHP
jgi:hypothetical protein